jgi:hypothetical protein
MEVPSCIEKNKYHNFFAKNKMSNNAIMKKLIMTLKRKENFDFLVNFMVANAIVIFEAQGPKTFIIAAHFIIKNAPPSNYNGHQDQATTKLPPKML